MPVYHHLIPFSNLPYCQDHEALQEMIENWFLSSFVLTRAERKLFKVKVLPTVERDDGSKRKQWALLCGVKLSPARFQLLRMSRIVVKHQDNERLAIVHHNKFSYDQVTGEPVMQTSSAYQRLISMTVFGINHRKLLVLFKQKSMRQVNLEVFDGNSTALRLQLKVGASNGKEINSLGNRDKSYWERIFSKASTTVLDVQLQKNGESLTVSFGTPLDALQAIRFLNLNSEILGASLEFQATIGRNPDKSSRPLNQGKSTCCDRKGLGLGGSILDVAGVFKRHKYIPVSEMDPSFGNFEALNNSLTEPIVSLRCYTCRRPYKIVGISPDLSFASALCGCDYKTPYPTSSKTMLLCQPIRWTGESFTRIATTSQLWQNNPEIPACDIAKSLVIHHEPLLLEYESCLEYSFVAVKMLRQEHEWQKVLLARQEVTCTRNEPWPFKLTCLGRSMGSPDVNNSEDLEIVFQKYGRQLPYYIDQENQDRDELLAAAHLVEELEEGSEVIKKIYRLDLTIPISDLIPNNYESWDEMRNNWKYLKMEGRSFRSDGKIINQSVSTTVPNVNNESFPSIFLKLQIQFIWSKPDEPLIKDAVRKLLPIPDQFDFDKKVECLRSFVDSPALPILTEAYLGKEETQLYQENNDMTWNPKLKEVSIVPNPTMEQAIWNAASLQPSQIEAVQSSLKYMLSLIQGPPGTGKTTVSSALISMILLRNPGKVLIATPSNAAADAAATSLQTFVKLLPKLAGKISIVRMYSVRTELSMLANRTKELPFSTLHQKVRTHDNWERLLRTLPDGEHPDTGRYDLSTESRYLVDAVVQGVEKEILQKCDVIVATLATATDQRLEFLYGKFSTILVDETGQVLEYDLIKLLKFRPKRLVFVGDHQQLRPMVLYDGCKMGGLNRSLLERATLLNSQLAAAGQPTRFKISVLREQHRMHQSICEVVSKLFYSNRLVTVPMVLNRQVPSYVGKLMLGLPSLCKSRVQFIDGGTEAKEEADGTSLFNEKEVSNVVKMTKYLVNKLQVPPASISIITPYEAQRRRLSDKLQAESDFAAVPSVGNVDGIQGQQNEIVIFSTVRTYKGSKKYEFLADEGRLCVALSRSKELLLVFGDSLVFQNSGIQALKRVYDLVIGKGNTQTMKNIARNFGRE